MNAKLGPFNLGTGTVELLPHAVPDCGAHTMLHHKQGETEIHSNPTPDQLRHIAAQFLIAADLADVLQKRAKRKNGGAS